MGPAVRLRALIDGGSPVKDALLQVGGPAILLGGAWRIFSADFPAGGADAWNASAWRRSWEGLPDFYAFGEDVFGNPLALLAGQDNAFLVDHESGTFHDLGLDPVTLIEACASGGLDWIDFYEGDALAIAASEGACLAVESHLHWVTPLILGGRLERSNVAPLPREQHMRGHADLWRQLGGAPLGARIVVR
jgi:hypothetical protein